MFSRLCETMIIPVRDDERGITYTGYPNVFAPGEILSRREVSERVGRSYSAVVYNLERAVSAGLLNKQYGFTNRYQPGWVYALPATMPRTEGF
jgi:hypothetical protein